jgi:methyl-accepting chemotaxis protein
MDTNRLVAWIETARSPVPDHVRERLILKLGLVFAVVVVVLAAVGGVTYVQTGDTLQQDTEAQLVGSTRVQAESVGEWVQRMEDRTRFVARASEVVEGDGGERLAFMQAELERLPDHAVAMHYVDISSTEVLASTDGAADGEGFDDAVVPWAAAVPSDGDDPSTVGRTRPYQDPFAGATATAFVARVPGESERGIVLVVDLEQRSAAFERPWADSWTHVVNSEGAVVITHRAEKLGDQNMGGPGVDSMGVEQGLEGETGYVEMEMREQDVVMGFAPVEGTDWVVMTHMSRSDAFALQQDILNSIALLVVIAFLGLGLVGATVGRNTVVALETLSSKARALEEGDLDVELETSRIDEVGRLYASFGSMRDSLRAQVREATDARDAAEVARAEAEELNEHLESKAVAYEQVMQSCAEGDLTRRMDPDSDSDAMQSIAEAFNAMIDQHETVTHQLKTFAEEVAASSEEVTASSEEVQSSADEVASAVQEISAGADEQRDTLQSIAEEMNSLSTTTEEMAASANQVAETAELTAETGDDARETAEEAIAEMESVEREAETTVDAIEALQARMSEIEEITEFITEVAEQTNILALNANIEAARAGEAGEGFAVVADEVKDLAEDTRQAAEEIETLIADLRGQTTATVEEVRATSEEVSRSTEAVEETVEALREIAEYAEETNVGIQEISEATTEQASSTNEVVSMADEAAAIAEQTADEASTVAGASEEQTAALSEMTDSAGTLASEADTLRNSLERFETEPDERQAAADAAPVAEAEDD